MRPCSRLHGKTKENIIKTLNALICRKCMIYSASQQQLKQQEQMSTQLNNERLIYLPVNLCNLRYHVKCSL